MSSEPTKDELKSRIIEILKTLYDPEIPVDIFELGLIYDIDIDDKNDAHIKMTLTTPNCPVAESLPAQVEERVKAVKGLNQVEVVVVWDPPWNTAMMSEAAKLELGFL